MTLQKRLLTGSILLLATLPGLPAFAADAPPADSGAPMAYNGGQPSHPRDLKGKKIVLADVPKLIGIGYFAATAKGIAEGCAEITKNGEPTQVTTDAPTEGDIQKQIEYIDNAISRGVDGIFFAANDPVAISPVLRKALKSGIHVIGYYAESEPNAREWFVQMCTPDGVAKALIDSLVSQVGPSADFAIVTSSTTAAGQNAWIAEIKKYIPAAGLKLNLVTILPAEEDQQLAFKVTGQILKAYPNVKGIIGLSSVAGPGVADAITSAGLIGKIAVIPLSTPNQMKPFVKNGAVKEVVLWNRLTSVTPRRTPCVTSPTVNSNRATRRWRRAALASCRSSTAARSFLANRSFLRRITSISTISEI